MKKSVTYKDAGVDIDAGAESVRRIKEHVKKTFNKNVLSGIGSFGGLFELDKTKCKNPVLVSSSDGVGTKLKLAFATGKHDTIGQDLVNHCVNDILVQGAVPLFFLDYIGSGKVKPDVISDVVKGLSIACVENKCALIGGEIAEMPGMYASGEYDLASFIVGVVEKEKIIDGSKIKPGDKVIALMSTGLHTNGYSLAQKVLFEVGGLKHDTYVEELGTTVAEELMKVHKSYLNPIKKLMDKVEINGMAHITGGGLVDNIPRILPKDCLVEINKSSWEVPAIFEIIQEKGNVPDDDMWRTFNMGIGLVVIVPENKLDASLEILEKAGEKSIVIGEVKKGKQLVELK